LLQDVDEPRERLGGGGERRDLLVCDLGTSRLPVQWLTDGAVRARVARQARMTDLPAAGPAGDREVLAAGGRLPGQGRP
jgi:hypothetical protein